MHKKLITQMTLIGEYILIPSINTSKIKWKESLKLELYIDSEKTYIYPKLYACDKFSVTTDSDKNNVIRKVWFEESGWFFPTDAQLCTIIESEALEIINKYINHRIKGEDIPAHLQQVIKEREV